MLLRLADPIIQQTQPTPVCCTATCIAMAVGMPVEQLGVVLTNALDFDDFGVWLAERGIWLRRGIRIDQHGERFQQGRVYLVSIRSLNLVQSDHAVLLDTRGAPINEPGYDERSGWKTFDPNFGRDGKKVCDWVDEHYVIDFCEFRERGGPYVSVGTPP